MIDLIETTPLKKQKKRRQKHQKTPEGLFESKISEFSHQGKGITDVNGKTTFVDYAIKDETVRFKYEKMHSRYDEATVVDVLDSSPLRVKPKCAVFGICGGCSLQHLSTEGQLTLKMETLKSHFKHFGQIQPQAWLAPLVNDDVYYYRNKARLGVRYVHKKEKVLVGFRERGGRFITDMDTCPILHESLKDKIIKLKALILLMSIYREIPQVEVAVDDYKSAFIIRHLKPFSDEDLDHLKTFALRENIWIYLQSKGPETVKLFYPEIEESQKYLSYKIDKFDIDIRFQPNDFTQVNPKLNQKMLSQAIKLLELKSQDSVLDLFCGLGNFSLPIARVVKSLTGVEGDEQMTLHAFENAKLNGIDNCAFYAANLFESIDDKVWANKTYDKILLDPPRAGALEIINQIERFKAKKIVYVSCNPATLARDAGILVHEKGYTMTKAGIMDMFPHTAHVESIAVFEKY